MSGLVLTLGCHGTPKSAASMTLAQALLDGMSVEASSVGSPPVVALDLMVTLNVSQNPNVCPVLDGVAVTVNGQPATQPPSAAGGVVSVCTLEGPGPDRTCWNHVDECISPIWSFDAPTGPLTVVAADSSAALTMLLGDVASPRSLALVTKTSGTPADGGVLEVRWLPPTDTVWVINSADFNLLTADGGVSAGDWIDLGVQLEDGGILLSAGPEDQSTVGTGGSGLLTLTGQAHVPVSRCDFPACSAVVDATPTLLETWFPW